MSEEIKKEEYIHGQPPLDLDGAKLEGAPSKPNLLFTTSLIFDNGSKETIYHIGPPQYTSTDLIQFPCKDHVVVFNVKFIRRASTIVQEIKPENGSRIIV